MDAVRPSIAHVTYSGDESAADIKRLLQAVADDEDAFEPWNELIQVVEKLENGLTRNSSPAAIELARNVFDCLLAKFPLFFGFWKKYADMEFNIGGTEAAELVYERGVASIPNSVDLWQGYCIFKTNTCHDLTIIRELFERGAACVGLDFMSHPFWEAYLDFEVRMDAKDNECRILEKIIHVPTQQYTRYFERFRNRAADRPVEQIVQPDVLAQLQSDLTTELDGRPTTALEYERLLRARIDQFHLEVYHRTATEVQKRWQFEELLKRPYFHVTTLEEIQVITWRQYLTFEQQEGDETRIIFLFERCLVTCALYDEFWFKYLHWMLRLPNKQEEVRLLYMRASCLFVPIGRPAIRHSWARFEEAMGRAEVAKSICEGILAAMPSQLEAITHIANISRRQHGLETGLDVFDRFLGAAGVDHWHAASLIAEKARMMWNATGHVDKTRHLYHAHLMTYLDSRYLWINFVRFELGLPATLEKNEDAHQRVRDVIKLVMEKATLPPHVMQDLIQLYMDWLDERGVGNVCEEWLWLDKETHGDFMVRSLLKTRLADDGQESTTDRRLASENGHPGVAVNDALVRRGHNIYARYYEEQGETPAMNEPIRFS